MTLSIFPHRAAWMQLPPHLRRGRHRLRVAHGPARSLLLNRPHAVQVLAATRRLVPSRLRSVAMYAVVPAVLYAGLLLAIVGTR